MIASPARLAACLILVSASRNAASSEDRSGISVDVSPDGRTVVFDLRGDLYTVPIGGGAARQITRGAAVDRDPRWSPDGKRIAFASDRGGWDNLWTIEPRTGRLTALTHDSLARRVVAPSWSADGSEIVISFGESAPGFEIVTLDGGGRQRYQTEPAGQLGGRGVTGAVFSRDGRTLVFQSASRRVADVQLYRYDRLLRQQRAITAEARGAWRPVFSPDGRRLAFVIGANSATATVEIRDVESGTERGIGRVPWADSGRGRALDVPGCAFTPNGASLLISGEGKLWRLDVANGARREIPFRS
jgi:Tol biopolymer transport system component